jgi:hypothetical protein
MSQQRCAAISRARVCRRCGPSAPTIRVWRVRSFETAMLDYLDRRNNEPKPFVWTAEADLILGKVQRLSKRSIVPSRMAQRRKEAAARPGASNTGLTSPRWLPWSVPGLRRSRRQRSASIGSPPPEGGRSPLRNGAGGPNRRPRLEHPRRSPRSGAFSCWERSDRRGTQEAMGDEASGSCEDR